MASTEREDLLGDGRLFKQVLQPGTGRRPEPGDWARVHYTCKLAGSDEVLDSSRARGESFSFVLGQGDVIPGLESGVASMSCGEQVSLLVHPDLAYGAAGCGGGAVPPAADAAAVAVADGGASASDMPRGSLHYELELLEVGRSAAVAEGDEEELSPEERLQRAMRAKDAGNAHFKAAELAQAAEAYAGALRLLGHMGPEQRSNENFLRENEVRWSDSARKEARDKLLLACLLNLAQCELKLERYIEAFQHCSDALDLDPKSSKAHYRRGLAALGTGLLDQAKADLSKAAHMEPKSAEIRAQLQVCQQRIHESDRKDRTTFGGMFGRGSIYGEKGTTESGAAASEEAERGAGEGGSA